jgi:hypothetical protein
MPPSDNARTTTADTPRSRKLGSDIWFDSFAIQLGPRCGSGRIRVAETA